MAFIRAVLDEQVDYGFEGGPEYLSEVVELENGFEYVNGAWHYPRHRYSARFGNIRDEDRDYLINVFHACGGRLHAFKFKDWNDYQAINQPLLVEAGTRKPVQLYKTYSFGEAYRIRPIQALAFASVELANGTAVAGEINFETGVFIPDNNWEDAAHRWNGEFYVWVRFDADYNAMTIASWQANTSSIELFERKRVITAENIPASWAG